jgi:HK97 family phage prohead protease
MSDATRTTRLAAAVQAAETRGLDGIIKGTAIRYGKPVERMPGLFERVELGAFRAQLGAANRVLVLWNHNWDAPIGRATTLKDFDSELRFEAKVSTHEEIPEARKALALLDEQIIDEISVGFEWGTWHEERDSEAGTVTIVHTKARLREFSITPFGAMERDATVKSVASAEADAQAASRALIRARLEGLRA